jgi:SAM-dependent MidA family methyltransferase
MSVLLCAALQVGAQAMAVVESLARRLSSTGGAALLVDYGANKPYSNSLTGE